MKAVRYATAFLLLLAVPTGCDSIDRFAGAPSRTSVPLHLPPFQEPGLPVAVCYNKSTATADSLAAAALEQCPEPGSTVEYLTGDLHINDCPLLKKRRAVYLCREPRLSSPPAAPR